MVEGEIFACRGKGMFALPQVMHRPVRSGI